jgi:exosortase A-associated hydrolase 2
MNAPQLPHPQLEAFFFDADPGTRFSLYHAPDPFQPMRGAILYVHPFAEELNHTRRMAAVQSRAFAALGYAVLQIDLFGCGDSCGDSSVARWDIWKRDLAVAREWLAERCPGPMLLWGLRLGGLLALDFACTAPVDGIILWQPFTKGRTCIDQFLRQHLVAQLQAGEPSALRSTSLLRARLAAQRMLEVGGYTISAELTQAIDNIDALHLPLPPCPVHWFASGVAAAARQAANVERLGGQWKERGATLHYHPIKGLPFWSNPEHSECSALLAATGAVFAAMQP